MLKPTFVFVKHSTCNVECTEIFLTCRDRYTCSKKDIMIVNYPRWCKAEKLTYDDLENEIYG